MALNLEQYIRQSYKTPNPGVLKGLGANEELINYLKETPWNTNFNVLKNWVEKGDDGWTTIRLDAQRVESLSQYVLISSNEEDINNYQQLLQLYQNNQHPIIKAKYAISTDETASFYNNDNGMGFFRISENDSLIIGADYFIPMGYLESGQLFDYDVLLVQFLCFENDYIEVKYKTGDYYTINIGNGEDVGYIERGDSWAVPSSLDGYLSDGTNEYVGGDIITPSSDMTLTFEQQDS